MPANLSSNVIWGSYGDERVTSSAKIDQIPLGARMSLPDGRIYAYAKCSATAGVAGQLYQQDAGLSSGDAEYRGTLATVAGSLGSTLLQITAGATTAVTAGDFDDGIAWVANGSGEGHAYRIRTHDAAAANSTCSVTLYKDDPIKVAVAAGTSTVGLRENEFKNLTVVTADTVAVGPIAGVLPVAVTASYYCWVQRHGPAAVFTDNTTPIIGNAAVASSTVAGQAAAITGTAGVNKSAHNIGFWAEPSGSSLCSLIYLTLD
jgi:hypothetical protein